MKNVYIVVGTCGIYPQHSQWASRALASESEANAFCDLLNAEWESRSQPREGEPRFHAKKRAAFEMRPLDPKIVSNGFDPTRWGVIEVPWGTPSNAGER